MIYTEFKDKKLSLLGFGTMRLPTLPDGSIDERRFAEMTDIAIKSGVNYFDTAWPYHSGMSETVVGKVLSFYPRDSFYLATKFPGHQISDSYDPRVIFEKQLEKCRVDYFDFYLLHNVYESSMSVYLDERWGILDYFKEQKREGRIKHLGFSSHARIDTLERFLEIAGKDMEFCQIQLNYVDWTLQNAKGKVELLNKYDIPIWVMEPVRGGKLCKMTSYNEQRLKAFRPDDSIASWGFRFLQDIPGVKMILSGMSDMEQMKDNLRTFEKSQPLSEKETELVLDIAEFLKNSVPCTACRYCTDGCPMGLDIPLFIETYNELKYSAVTNTSMRLDHISKEKMPSACIGCGNCTAVCPQKIKIPGIMNELDGMLTAMPKWKDICKVREKEQK